jgi:hypothetical protein
MLDQAQISNVAKNAGIPFDTTLADEIYNIAADYDSLKQAEAQGAETRENLKAIKKSLNKTLETLAESKPPTKNKLESVYRGEFFSRRFSRRLRAIAIPPTPSDDFAAVERLSEATGIVLDQLPRGGAPLKEARDRLFVQLAKLYKVRSGREFKYPDKKSSFRGSNFVRGIAQIIDAHISENECIRALRAADRLLRAERKSQKPT